MDMYQANETYYRVNGVDGGDKLDNMRAGLHVSFNLFTFLFTFGLLGFINTLYSNIKNLKMIVYPLGVIGLVLLIINISYTLSKNLSGLV